jgi:hypothetical protein
MNGPLPGLPVGAENKWKAARTERPDLMPCPFCGGPPALISYTHPEWGSRFQVMCCNEGCETVSGTTRQKSFEAAVHVWSSRPTITKLDLNDVLTSLDEEQFHKA